MWTGFMLGVVGSLHCIGMCGPLAIALPRAGSTRATFVFGRVLYNLGRVVTYSVLGALFGLVGKTLFLAGIQQGLSIGIGVLMLLLVLFGPRFGGQSMGGAWLTRVVAPLQKALGEQLKKRSLRTLFTVGLLNGLLPCGLVIAALAGATAMGSIGSGALYMALFGLGTVPVMFAISVFGQTVFLKHRTKLQRLVPVGVSLVAVLLILRGLSLGIPYISPDMATGACCH